MNYKPAQQFWTSPASTVLSWRPQWHLSHQNECQCICQIDLNCRFWLSWHYQMLQIRSLYHQRVLNECSAINTPCTMNNLNILFLWSSIIMPGPKSKGFLSLLLQVICWEAGVWLPALFNFCHSFLSLAILLSVTYFPFTRCLSRCILVALPLVLPSIISCSKNDLCLSTCPNHTFVFSHFLK